MKVINSDPHSILFRFDTSESVWDELLKYCTDNKLSSGVFSAIGACKEVVLSYYNLDKKVYDDKPLTENLEILTITGNIAQMDGKYLIHAHGSFGRNDFSVVGGHIKKLVTSATCELTLQLLSETVSRFYDEETGLNLLK